MNVLTLPAKTRKMQFITDKNQFITVVILSEHKKINIYLIIETKNNKSCLVNGY